MTTSAPPLPPIAFIGGGNMASAIIGGLIRRGLPAGQIEVVEPFEPARTALFEQFGITAQPAPTEALTRVALVVWAVKPQTFKEAALPVAPHTAGALHLSVAAGIRTDSIGQWLASERIVRAMPNTPALIGQGMTGLYSRAGSVDAQERALVEQVVTTTGAYLWVEQESLLDAVTALSGSGPAYVFYFLEAMTTAGEDMGLTQAQARQLAVATFAGASELARRSDESLDLLRQRVTSKGGTTHAAIESMEADQVAQRFMRALDAAQDRARELGDEFGSAA
ncbi:MAG: pyrroline-5-carboxylate reductase [Proteobacteria bacterium]|nr:pyrroline-5-carboxylate reductase [Pseudomonadota bacterium]